MRNSDEQMQVILRKAHGKKEKRARRLRVLREAGLSALCLAAIVAAAFFIPRVETAPQEAADGALGSLILSSPSVGYIVIGALSFALGICLTFLCLRLRENAVEKNGDDADD